MRPKQSNKLSLCTIICNHSATPLGNSRVNSFFSALVINTAYPPMGNSAADNFIFQPCSYYSKFHWGKNPHFKLLPCGASKKFCVVLEWWFQRTGALLRVATVREKVLENEKFSRSGKSQGISISVREILKK